MEKTLTNLEIMFYNYNAGVGIISNKSGFFIQRDRT